MKKFTQFYTPAQLQEALLQKNLTEVPLVESSISRLFQMVQEDDRTFGIISAFRGTNPKEENLAAHAALKKKVRAMGYGYIELRGGYREETGDVEELSIMIPNIKKTEIVKLGRENEQHSVMFKDKQDFYYIGTNESSGIGKVLMSFHKGAGTDNMDLAKSSVLNFYSQLKKASDRDRKFVFKSKDKPEETPETQKAEAELHDVKQHKAGDVWKTASGVWGAKNAEGNFEYFEDKEKALNYAKNKKAPKMAGSTAKAPVKKFKIQEREEWCFAKAAYLRRGEEPKWITIYEE